MKPVSGMGAEQTGSRKPSVCRIIPARANAAL